MNRRRDIQRTVRSALITGVGIALLASGGPVVAGDADRQLAQRGLESFEIEPNSRSLRKTLKQTREVQTVRFAQQFGLAYLPLMVIRQHRLIEKHVTAAGLGNVRIEWSRVPFG